MLLNIRTSGNSVPQGGTARLSPCPYVPVIALRFTTRPPTHPLCGIVIAPGLAPGTQRRTVCVSERDLTGSFLLIDESFDELGHFGLLVSRQLTGSFENLAESTDWSGCSRRLRCVAKKLRDADLEEVGELLKLLSAEGDVASLPCGIGLLSDTEFMRHLSLGKSLGFTGSMKPRAELTAFRLSRATCLHGHIIRVVTGK